MSSRALDLIAGWPVDTAAAAVVGPSGVLATYGDTARRFRLASVTKPLAARAAQVAVEEGVVDLDTPAGPPGATVRHLLSHASGLAMHSAEIVAEPGTRRCTPTTDSPCWPNLSSRRPGSSSAST